MTLKMRRGITGQQSQSERRLILRNAENRNKYNVTSQVVMEERAPLVGRKAAEDKKLISVNYDIFRQLHDASEVNDVISVDDNKFGTLQTQLLSPKWCHQMCSTFTLTSQYTIVWTIW